MDYYETIQLYLVEINVKIDRDTRNRSASLKSASLTQKALPARV